MERYLDNKILFCSLCGKSQMEVAKLIAAPALNICDACVDLMASIMLEDGVSLPETSKWLGSRVGSVPQLDETKAYLQIKPRFVGRNFVPRLRHIFYLCPFGEPFDSVYNDHIKGVAAGTGFTIDRADEIYGTQPIIEDIWTAINCSQVIIADVTGRNPNVMYEVGIAHTVGKHVVILSQDVDDIPFDVKHQRCIVYSFTPRGCARLEEQVRGTLLHLNVP